MSELVVDPVRTSRARRQFLGLPWLLHRDDPHWIPPLRLNQRLLAGFTAPWWMGGRRHPFYDNAEVQPFLATRRGQPCGRIAAIVNHAHNRKYNERRGFFGFFESVDDADVARQLLDAAASWLRSREMDVMRGPTNPSMNYECGLLIAGFDRPPFFMMTYNPPFYARFMDAYGMEKAQDLFAYWGHVEMLSSLDSKLAFICDAARERFNISVRPLNTRQFTAEVEMFLDVYNRSFDGMWGFVPLSKSETHSMAHLLRHLIAPELTIVAEADGQVIGCLFGILDFNHRIKQIDGRLSPSGIYKLLRNLRAIHRVRMLSTNVIPAYQRWGVALVMLGALVPKVLEWGIEEAEFSWVTETNDLSRKSLEKGGAKLTNTYRIYDLPLSAR